MSDERRCPNCGALAAADARWCGQCYASLTEAPRPEEATPGLAAVPDASIEDDLEIDWSELEAAGIARPATPGPASGAAPAAPVGARVAAGAGTTGVSIRRVGEALVWACPQCELENAMEASVCARCQTPFASLLVAEQAAERELPPANTILLSALLLPGLGHIRLGRAAEGIARLILFLWAAGLGLMMLLSLGGGEPADPSVVTTTPAPSGSPGAIVAVGALFVASAIGIWGVSAMDAMRLARGDDDQILKPRVLLIGTIVLTVLSIGAFVAAGISSAPTS